MEREDFLIPAYAPAHPVTDDATLEDDASVVALFSHMHLRGHDMQIVAHMPEGGTETLVSIPNFNFDWQLAYYVEPGSMRLPKGTRVETVAHYDNSAFNPYNPAPEKDVPYGPQTVDEMMNGFIFYTRENETLDIQVDPETGWEVTAMAKK